MELLVKHRELGIAAYLSTLAENYSGLTQHFFSEHPRKHFAVPEADELAHVARTDGPMASVRCLVAKLVDQYLIQSVDSDMASSDAVNDSVSRHAIRPYRVSRTGVIHTRRCEYARGLADQWTTLNTLERLGIRCCKVCKPEESGAWRSVFEQDAQVICRQRLVEPSNLLVKSWLSGMEKRRPESLGVLIGEEGFFHPKHGAFGTYFPPSMTRVQINDVYVKSMKANLFDPIAGLEGAVKELWELWSGTGGTSYPADRRRDLIHDAIRTATKKIERLKHPEKYKGLQGCGTVSVLAIAGFLSVIIAYLVRASM